MLKQTVTFENFDGEEVTKDLYFNISVDELLEMEASEEGFSDKVKTVIKSEDRRQILAIFKDIVFKAYGVKSEDGNRFVKSEELNKEFAESAAYEAFFVDLMTSEKTSAEFIGKLLPKSLDKIIGKAEMDKIKAGIEPDLKPAKPKKAKDMTREELLAAYQAKEAERSE